MSQSETSKRTAPRSGDTVALSANGDRYQAVREPGGWRVCRDRSRNQPDLSEPRAALLSQVIQHLPEQLREILDAGLGSGGGFLADIWTRAVATTAADLPRIVGTD